MDGDLRVRPKEMKIGIASQSGMDYKVYFDDYAVRLPDELTSDHSEGIDEYGNIAEDFVVQSAEHDFEKDGVPEIIIAVGNGLTDLAINVFKYHPPQQPKDARRVENWELIGQFRGQSEMIVDASSFSLPFGGQGRFAEYLWAKGRFVEIQ